MEQATFSQLTDTLFSTKQLTLQVDSKVSALSLRASLGRKFSSYKIQLEALGFLESDMKNASLSMEWEESNKTVKFFLRPRQRVAKTYTILGTSTDVGATEDADY
jgi:hypothetical protein